MIKNLVLIFLSVLLVSACSISKVRQEVWYSGMNNNKVIDKEQLPKEARKHFLNGSTAQMKNNHYDAILDFQLALKYENSPSIYYAMAKSFRQLRRFEQAIDACEKALSYNDQFLPALEVLSEIYLDQMNIDKSAEIMAELIKVEPTLERKLIQARIEEFRNKKLAIQLYQNLISEYNSPDAKKRMAEMYKAENDTIVYQQYLEELRIEEPEDLEITTQLLELYIVNADWENYNKLVDELSGNISIDFEKEIFSVTARYLIEGFAGVDTTFTRNLINKVDARYKFDWRLNYSLAILGFRINEPKLAMSKFNDCVRAMDTIPELYLGIAGAADANLLNSYSIKILEQGIEAFPEELRLFNYMSYLYYKQKDYDKSLEKAFIAYSLDSINIEVISQIASCYDKMKNSDSCYYWFEKALNIDEKNATALNNYAYVLAENNDSLDKAYKMSKLSLKEEPNNPSFLDTYGWILFKKGEYSIAKENIYKAINISGGNGELYEHLGDIFLALNDINSALSSWKKSLEFEPDRESVIEKIKMSDKGR